MSGRLWGFQLTSTQLSESRWQSRWSGRPITFAYTHKACQGYAGRRLYVKQCLVQVPILSFKKLRKILAPRMSPCIRWILGLWSMAGGATSARRHSATPAASCAPRTELRRRRRLITWAVFRRVPVNACRREARVPAASPLVHVSLCRARPDDPSLRSPGLALRVWNTSM